MSYEEYALSKEDFENGINNFFIQLLIEARFQRKNANSLKDLSTKTPTISYLIGQAGSGKTTLRRYIRDKKYTDNGECVVELDADKLATFHRYYDQLLKLPPDDFYRLTREFIKPANEIIHQAVMANKLNVVKEKVMHRGEADYQEVSGFKSQGYKVDMNIIAVDGYESFLCCIERDINLIKNGFDPRRVTKADHDRMYYPFIQELREFSRRGLCDSINIYGRGETVDKPKLLYSTEVKDETELNVEGSIEAIEVERDRMHKQILANPSTFLNRIRRAKEDINTFIKDEKMKKEYLGQLRELEIEINRELSIERE